VTPFLAAVLLFGLVACARPDAETDSADSFCVDVPVLTWENFGNGLVVEHCQACHASTSTNRNGAPEDIVFDSDEDTQEHMERIYQRVVVERTMPPQGGLLEDDLSRVEIWIRCWETYE
jgi:uncharacterized membrane protein